MDKTEISERMAKAVVQSLLDNDVIRVYAKLKHYLTMNPYITKELLEKYIREAILKYVEDEDLTLFGKEYCEVDEGDSEENGEDRV